jgi:hypothetical protein
MCIRELNIKSKGCRLFLEALGRGSLLAEDNFSLRRCIHTCSGVSLLSNGYQWPSFFLWEWSGRSVTLTTHQQLMPKVGAMYLQEGKCLLHPSCVPSWRHVYSAIFRSPKVQLHAFLPKVTAETALFRIWQIPGWNPGYDNGYAD